MKSGRQRRDNVLTSENVADALAKLEKPVETESVEEENKRNQMGVGAVLPMDQDNNSPTNKDRKSNSSTDVVKIAMKEQQKAQINYLWKKTQQREEAIVIKTQRSLEKTSFIINGELIKKKLSKFLDHTAVVVYMTIITIYALYFDDIKILFFPKTADDIFNGITLIVMLCFALEIFFASYAKPEYMFSFFFYLDIISTASMIPDCGWIWNAIVENDEGEGDSATALAKTGRAGRVTRIIRVLRLIRLIRIVKLYK